ncbi:MAG: hypothetical protein ACK5S6_03790 [bacterium]|jgi:hypothetical protein
MDETQLDGKPETATRDINDRVNVSLAVGRYARAVARFEEASTEFNAACLAVRAVLKPEERFITKVSYTYYLVETNDNGDFDITPIDVV